MAIAVLNLPGRMTSASLVFPYLTATFTCDIGAIVINVVNGQGFAAVDGGGERHRLAGPVGASITVLLFRALPPSREIRLTVMCNGVGLLMLRPTAAGGQGQLSAAASRLPQSGRTINKFKARTDRQLQHVLAFIFLDWSPPAEFPADSATTASLSSPDRRCC